MKRTSLRLAALLTALLMLLSLAPGALAVDNSSSKQVPGCPSEDAKIRNNGNHMYYAEVDEPTCTEPGMVWWQCIYCDDMQEEILPALGHDWGEWIVLLEPTCTEEGARYRICNRCGAGEDEPIPALGHDWVKTMDSATCTEGGLANYYCRRCQAVKEENTPPLGHLWDGGVVTKQPTETEEGIRTYTCQRDPSHTYTETIPKLQPSPAEHQHQFGDWFVEEPGNCVRKTLLRHKCSCGADEYKYGDYGDHDWGEWQVVTPAAPGVPGLERRICKIEASHMEEHELPALPKEDPKPSLSLSLIVTPGYEQTEYHLMDQINLRTVVTNTGNVPLYYVDYFRLPYDSLIGTYTAVLQPGESTYIQHFHNVFDNDGGAWKEGRVAVAFADPADAGSYATVEEAQARASAVTSNEDWIIVPIESDGTEDGHGATLECLNGPETGVGKRYEGAVMPLHFRFTNTGSSVIYLPLPSIFYDVQAPGGMVDSAYVLQPGQSLTFIFDYTVTQAEADAGVATLPADWGASYRYEGTDGGEGGWDWAFTVVQIPLTLNGSAIEAPPDAAPALKLIYEGDSDELHNPVTKDVLDPDERIWADYTCINIGNVPLTLQIHTSAGAFWDDFSSSKPYDPGESLTGKGVGYCPVGAFVAPGTETAELQGTATVTYYFTGHDPLTGEQLCQSNEISRTWKVGKPGPKPWPIPDESDMAVYQFEETCSSNPKGYVKGEYYAVWAVVDNFGLEDVEDYELYFPLDGVSKSGGYLASGDWDHWVVRDGYVTDADVQMGYIYCPPMILTWVDPFSGNTITRYSESVLLDVIDDSGLTVIKTIKNMPERGYFLAGETIEWDVSITNNNKNPFSTVTVTDKCEQIGYFEEIGPGETKHVDVPGYLVDEYDVSLGKAVNIAEVTAHDGEGMHWYFSNESKAPCGPWSPIPPVVPPETPVKTPHEDPLVPAVEEHVGALVYKTELSYPANGLYYVEGEQISYDITVKNTGSVDLDSIILYDSLAGLAPVSTAGYLPAGQETHFVYAYTVTASDVDAGWVYNTAVAEYSFGGMKGTPVTSNTVKSPTSATPPHDPGGKIDKDKLPPASGNGPASCEVRLISLGEAEGNYTLHACGKHAATATAAEAAAASGDAAGWKQAGDLWREEIDELYQALYDAADASVKDTVINDRAVFYVYVSQYEAMMTAGDAAAAQRAVTELLRMHCAELCAMVHTVPSPLPDSMTGSYRRVMNAGQPAQTNTRTIGALKGSDSELSETYDANGANALEQVKALVSAATDSQARVNAFTQAQRLWQLALDQVVNTRYRAADKASRKAIAACRVTLDQVYAARKALVEALYSDAPEVGAEALSNLYKNALFNMSK